MGTRLHLLGQRFGRLTVQADILDTPPPKNRRLHCTCDCGQSLITTVNALRTGKTRSCGCLRRDVARSSNTTHGRSKTPEWKAWCEIKQRCLNPSNHAYADYGGRGIRLHPPWVRDFAAFYDAIGPRPSPQLTLDRIDNDKGYVPGNLRWATRTEQLRNCRSNHRVQYQGDSLTIAELAERTGQPYQRLWRRIQDGWAIEDAVTLPSQR